MRNRVTAALLATLLMIPAGVAAQPAGERAFPLRAPPPAAHRPIPVRAGHWFVPPRPFGWSWGGPGWWGGAYSPPARGYIMPSFWLGPAYAVPDWEVYGFAQPGQGRRWVRYYDYALLVDGRGMIYDTVANVPWGRYTRGPVPRYVGDEPDSLPYDADYDDEVTWNGGSSRDGRQIWAWPSQLQATQSGTVIVVPPNSVATITFQPQASAGPAPVSYRAESWKTEPRAKVKPRAASRAKVVRRVPVKKD